MKILVTGGAGYLGSVLVRHLLTAGHYVRVLDKFLFGRNSIADLDSNDHFQVIEGDVSNLTDVNIAMTDIDAVISLAAIVGDPACQVNGDLTVRTNYWATKLLAEVAESQGVTKLLFASTCSVYGKTDGGLSNETNETKPLSLYAETKLKSEKALLELKGKQRPIILRLATLCGSSHRMRFDLVLNLMTATAFFEKEVRVYGGSQYRPILDVRDATKAFQLFLNIPNESLEHQIYNVGSNSQNVSILELGKLIADIRDDVDLTIKSDLNDERSYRVDFSRISNLDFKPRTVLRDSSKSILEMFESREIIDYKENRFYNARYDY